MTRIVATAAVATSLACLAAPAAAHEPKQVLMPENAPAREFLEQVGYSEAVVHGDTIYLAGVVAVQQEGEDSMEPAFVRVFEMLGRTLGRLGASWDDVLVFDTFHNGPMAPQLDALVPVKNRYIKAPFPTWTAVGVTELYEPDALLEIRLTLRNPAAGPAHDAAVAE